MERGTRDKWVLSEAAELFDLPVDLVTGLPHVEVLGDRQFYMEHHRGILSYSDTEIAVSAGGMILRLRGEHLVLVSMTGDALRVQGEIRGIEWVI